MEKKVIPIYANDSEFIVNLSFGENVDDVKSVILNEKEILLDGSIEPSFVAVSVFRCDDIEFDEEVKLESGQTEHIVKTFDAEVITKDLIYFVINSDGSVESDIYVDSLEDPIVENVFETSSMEEYPNFTKEDGFNIVNKYVKDNSKDFTLLGQVFVDVEKN